MDCNLTPLSPEVKEMKSFRWRGRRPSTPPAELIGKLVIALDTWCDSVGVISTSIKIDSSNISNSAGCLEISLPTVSAEYGAIDSFRFFFFQCQQQKKKMFYGFLS